MLMHNVSSLALYASPVVLPRFSARFQVISALLESPRNGRSSFREILSVKKDSFFCCGSCTLTLCAQCCFQGILTLLLPCKLGLNIVR